MQELVLVTDLPTQGGIMSLYDDMFELDAFFKEYVKDPDKVALRSRKERAGLSKAWKKVSDSHGDLERYEMKTEAVIKALSTVFNTFGLVREVKDGTNT